MARSVLLLAVAAAGLAALGCGREPAFPDRTARVTLDGEVIAFAVDSCLLDGRTAYVVGRAEDGRLVQAVVGVEADGATGVTASTGLTVTDDEAGVAAFGEEAWTRRGEEGRPPGTITSARIRGARIQARGRAAPVDAEDRPLGPEVEVAFDARCDEQDGE